MYLNPLLTVTANGTYNLGQTPSSSYAYKVDGTFGGGTVDVGYISNGAFVKYTDITSLTAAGQGILTAGLQSYVAFRVTGATSPVIAITIHLV
jgi:hypothetical protein